MKYDPKNLARILECQRALYGPPLSDEERAVYNSQRAAEMARAEARRSPSPQMELDRS